MYEKNLKIGYLLDFYGEALAERKRTVLDLYYNEDFSLAEISEEIGISRQGVRDLIKKAEDELVFFEETLGYSKKMETLSKSIDELLSISTEANVPKDIYTKMIELKKLIEQ